MLRGGGGAGGGGDPGKSADSAPRSGDISEIGGAGQGLRLPEDVEEE